METVHFIKIEDIIEKINKLFQLEKQRLQELFPTVDIQHIGSTAVPGSISKGDLDINIRVTSEQFNIVIAQLKSIYVINQPDNWSEFFASFKDDARNLGIQVTIVGSKEDYFVTQRDYLKNHPEVVKELNILKAKFEGKGMDEYRKEKGKFFEKLCKI